ncbi:MAG: magnesium-translocating P-type ATPase [Candidatus Planktophila sp.]
MREKRLGNSAALLIKQFSSPIVLILFFATAISIIAGDTIDGLIILAIIIPSGLLSFIQEHRAGRIMDGLLTQLATPVRVIRNGEELFIDEESLSIGDVVLLKAGDLIPADLKIIIASDLMVDESALTGESFPVEKSEGEIYFGTHVVSGTAQGRVFALGRDTRFGKLEADLQAAPPRTSFEIGIEDFGKLIAKSMFFLVTLIFLVNLYFHRPLLESLLFSLALAVGLTPQLLPAIISVSLSAGAHVMATKKVLVKRLDVIEDFGSMTALCTDKTGTLTLGTVSLDRAIDCEGKASNRVLELAALNASLQKSFLNPIDQAIVAAHPEPPVIAALDEIPYDFTRRMLSILTAEGEIVTKGAFHSVVDKCSSLLIEGELVELAGYRERIDALFQELSSKGGRVIAVASKRSASTSLSHADESELHLEGFLLFIDPEKPDAKESITQLKELGIEPFLITGDNPFAAQYIANRVGLKTSRVLDGKAISEMSELELQEALGDVRVLAEVDPIQKERIVLALKRIGHTVGFFGDGINDCAAIKAADVGISVSNAVPVAKDSAAVVLLESDLRVLADGVQLGRKTFLNTMKYIRVGLSAAFGNMLSMAIASIFLPFLPLLPIQILLLNFLSDFPALMIAGDNTDPESLQRPTRWDIKSIRRFMLIFGVISSLFDLLTFWLLINIFHADEVLFRSAWFIESTLTELVVMLVLRSQRPFWRSKPGKGLAISSALLALIVLALPYTLIGHSLKIDGVPAVQLATLAGLIVIYAAVNEVVKRRVLQEPRLS